MIETMSQAFSMMWRGMAGIFVVIGVIALLVYLLGRIDANTHQ